MLWLQIEFKIHLETKSNVQKESNTLKEIKGNEGVKKEVIVKITYMFNCTKKFRQYIIQLCTKIQHFEEGYT